MLRSSRATGASTFSLISKRFEKTPSKLFKRPFNTISQTQIKRFESGIKMESKTVKELQSQNAALREEIQSLSKSLQDIVHRQKQANMERKRPHPPAQYGDEELTALYTTLNSLKRRRDHLKNSLLSSPENNYSKMQNNLNYIKKQIKDSQEEKATLERLRNQQLNGDVDDITKEQMENIREDIRITKEQTKELQHKMKNEEIDWKKYHKQMVGLEEKLRQSKMSKFKNKEDGNKQSKELQDLNAKIQNLKGLLGKEEKKGKRILSEAETQLHTLKQEHEKLQDRLKSKEEELKIKEIKVKDLKSSLRQFK